MCIRDIEPLHTSSLQMPKQQSRSQQGWLKSLLTAAPRVCTSGQLQSGDVASNHSAHACSKNV